MRAFYVPSPGKSTLYARSHLIITPLQNNGYYPYLTDKKTQTWRE